MADHARRADPVRAPELARFLVMSRDERWLLRSPQGMLATFHCFRGEAFLLLLVDDLRALPAEPVLVEGFRLLPHLVAPLLPDPAHALWLLPTPALRRRALAARSGTDDVAGSTSDPRRALENLPARDALFTERLRGEVAALGLRALDVDGSLPPGALVRRVGASLWTPGDGGSTVRP